MATVKYNDAAHVDRREYMRIWSSGHKEKVSAWARRWRENNPEKKAALDVEYRETHSAERAAYSSEWAKKNPDKYRANMRVAQHKRRALTQGGHVTRLDWDRLLMDANQRCQKCGAEENLEMDHIVPLSMGGAHSPENLQVLCRSCNAKKSQRTEDWRI